MTTIAALALLTLLASCRGEAPTPPAAPAVLHLRFAFTSFGMTLGGTLELPIMVVSSAGDIAPAPPRLALVSRDSTVIRIAGGTTIESMRTGSTWLVASLDTAGQRLVDSTDVAVVCTAELVAALTPRSQTLAVGASFTPTIKLYTCGGHLSPTDTFRWSASDGTVVRVDSLSGTTTGLRAGQATVRVQGARYGQLGGVTVTVTAP
ncbi:MAG: Ig-like domain-containing protein [Gemmatimonadetes bacterium]|nr:Ig-like domain-containing protein [Gemmatimonadota bacterium]